MLVRDRISISSMCGVTDIADWCFYEAGCSKSARGIHLGHITAEDFDRMMVSKLCIDVVSRH